MSSLPLVLHVHTNAAHGQAKLVNTAEGSMAISLAAIDGQEVLVDTSMMVPVGRRVQHRTLVELQRIFAMQNDIWNKTCASQTKMQAAQAIALNVRANVDELAVSARVVGDDPANPGPPADARALIDRVMDEVLSLAGNRTATNASTKLSGSIDADGGTMMYACARVHPGTCYGVRGSSATFPMLDDDASLSTVIVHLDVWNPKWGDGTQDVVTTPLRTVHSAEELQAARLQHLGDGLGRIVHVATVRDALDIVARRGDSSPPDAVEPLEVAALLDARLVVSDVSSTLCDAADKLMACVARLMQSVTLCTPGSADTDF
jgi:hypothetical protein